MKLNRKELADRTQWTSKGYALPEYDIDAVREKTLREPTWIHFGAGNIFRVFPAVLQQKLLNTGRTDRGIIVGEAFDEEIIDKAYAPFDNLSLMVSLNPDGNIDKEVVGSVVHAVKASAGLEELISYFISPSLQMVSFTITEKGYGLKSADGQFFPWIAPDLEALPENCKSMMSLITLLMLHRYRAGSLPVALVSMDNYAHNGSRLYESVTTFAKAWAEKGLVDDGFLDYLDDPANVSFTWSMIDKITPRPAESAKKMLEADGFESTDIIITAKNTYTAPFVNAEPVQYLVIEDWFPNGRPPLEAAGVIFTDRETVDKVETMKVCTCLNPLHTVMAAYGCLLGFETIADTVADPAMKAFIEKVGYVEGMPVVVDPGILDPKEFIDTVINVRFPNPFLPDTPQRIATDTSQKIPVRFGETLKAYLRSDPAKLNDLTFIPLFFAGWLRYLLGVDDQGRPMERSSDPLLDELTVKLSGVHLGDAGPFDAALNPILSDASIFGIDLIRYGMDKKVLSFFTDMMTGPDAVRATLERALAQ